MPNRLASETSPYLLQHAENPVDWYPWGDEAFARARSEDKPLLISIGYAACHWCHVMERESFEDPAIAALMNEHFVCVKVDREERPDVDAIYMDAVQAMTGHGGWPLNAFVTPEGNPFWAGTYFPPVSRQQMPSWRDVVASLAQAWHDQRDEIMTAAREIVPRLAGAASLEAGGDEFDPGQLEFAVGILGEVFDRQFGGWGAAPKFPLTSVIEFLLARGERPMALQTLRRMASGGLYDQIGGGFARYSVDARWLVPHFEKMLYDNALLASAYLHAWQITDDPLFRRVCEETLDFAVRELRQDEGGFASSLDADSEGVEGKFYVWTPDQVRAALSSDLAEAAITHFGITEAGNFEGGSTVLTRVTGDPASLSEIKAGLLAARAARVRPALDDKRVCSWNALMISALAEAGAAFGRADYVSAAETCASFIESELRAPDGGVLRVFNRGVAKQPGFLDDYAYLLEAYLTLYEATFDERWFVRATELAEAILTRFHDPERGGFFSTAAEHTGLIARRKDLEDAPIPAGASSACFGLLRLARLTGERRYEDAAVSLIALLHPIAPKHPLAFGHLLRAMDFYAAPVREVALAGADVADLAAVVRRGFFPHVVLAGGGGNAVPLLEGREPVNGEAAAYVCENFTCGLPVTRGEELANLLQ
ncbi:thioredoxin domain-containing protein [Solirubrobacter sp. CPCC 204708]|uniref:Thioredoxin domain-containing protein n=1 Tax=Solirubrobacter deserti TaxID=2282478 RepID=A0ABT4RJM7_9ACTN|nr:thioredoxin domain-containing protein [Solirubrobacter deserti]MBE2319773.1 thioredoxin domain-containing protein [Solirubrobacter deserti]MDA0138744.1 thioredoxin domain-containing protein [Solirubrobacter deserti]